MRRQRDRSVHSRVRRARCSAETQPVQLSLEVWSPGEDALFVEPAQRRERLVLRSDVVRLSAPAGPVDGSLGAPLAGARLLDESAHRAAPYMV